MNAAENSARPVWLVFEKYGPYHLARARAGARGRRLLAVELFAHSQYYTWLNSQEKADGVELLPLKIRPESDLNNAGLLRQVIGDALDATRPEVVVFAGWSGLVAIVLLAECTRRGIPVVTMSESNEDDYPRRQVREFLKKALVEHCAAGLVGGSSHRGYLVRLGMPGDAIFLGYDAVDNEHFASGAQQALENQEQLRTQHNLPRQYFLVSSRLVARKNIPAVLEAYAECLRTSAGTDWDVVVIGDGPERDSLAKLTNNLGLEGRVQWRGAVPYSELPMFYGLAGALVLPSLVEQWGLVVNEAMASGIPAVVSSRCGSAREMFQGDLRQLVLDPGDRGALVTVMLRLILQTDFRERMAAMCQQKVADYGPDRFAAGFSAAVERAKAVPRRPSIVSRLVARLCGALFSANILKLPEYDRTS